MIPHPEAGRIRIPMLCGAVVCIMAACGSDSTQGPVSDPTSPQNLEGIWTVSGSRSAFLRLSPDQLSDTGRLAPVTEITTPSAPLHTLAGVAFDARGDLWIASSDDSVLLAFEPEDLDGSGSKQAATVIESNHGSLGGPTGLAFDRAGRLWVANHENGTLVRFDAGQLAAGGTPVPAVVLAGAGNPAALAFDADGSLWVSDNMANRITKYGASQLAGSGSPAPAVVLNANAGSLVNPAGLAFDVSGNLWVANISGRTLVAFTPAQLAVTGAPSPQIRLVSPAGHSLALPVGLAFDDQGSLWVIGATGMLSKFVRGSLTVSGSPVPSTVIRIVDHSLFWSVAFWPKPEGLPLN
jgi:sugar lactone lactonase YvrE